MLCVCLNVREIDVLYVYVVFADFIEISYIQTYFKIFHFEFVSYMTLSAMFGYQFLFAIRMIRYDQTQIFSYVKFECIRSQRWSVRFRSMYTHLFTSITLVERLYELNDSSEAKTRYSEQVGIIQTKSSNPISNELHYVSVSFKLFLCKHTQDESSPLAAYFLVEESPEISKILGDSNNNSSTTVNLRCHKCKTCLSRVTHFACFSSPPPS